MKGRTFKRGSTWTYVVDIPPDPVTGARKQKKKGGFPTQQAAEYACAELIASMGKNTYVPDNNITIKELLETWLEEYAKPNYKPTVYDVESTIVNKRIIPVIGKQRVQQIKPLTIARFYNELSKKYSADYVRHIHAILRKAFRLASKWEMISTNPLEKVESPKLRKTEMKVWTIEQCLQFLESAEDHVHYIAFSLAIHTGMRKGEILGLRWKDIDWDGQALTIQQTVNWTPSQGIIIQDTKTASSTRRISIGSMLVQDLQERKKVVDANKERFGQNYEPYDLVCCSENGAPVKPRRLTSVFEFLTKRTDLPKIRFHDLRHSHASMLLNNGVNPKIGAERLGHSSVQIYLDRYSHLLPDMQRGAVDLVEEKMKKIKNPVDNSTS